MEWKDVMTTSDGQRSKTKLLAVLAMLCIPYLALVIYLATLGSDRIRTLPRWVWWGMAAYFFATIFGFAFFKWWLLRKTVTPSTRPWEGPVVAAIGRRRVWRMFVYYILSMIVGTGSGILGIIACHCAIPGLVAVWPFLIFWWRQ